MSRRVAEILTIGDELLSGETVDSNSAHISKVLEELGVPVRRHTSVADDVRAIAEAVVEATDRAQIVITSGGLGPTRDDLTFEAVARALGVELRHHAETWERIASRRRSAGRPLTDNLRRQAMLPVGVEVLGNEVGSAPGIWAKRGAASLFVLPGVPREMRWLLEHRVVPCLPPGPRIARDTLAVAGLGESALETALAEVIAGHPDVQVGFRAQPYENEVKLRAEGDSAEERVAAAAAAVRAALGSRVFGGRGARLEAELVQRLSAAGATVATAESCTGGLVAKLLTDVPGSSATVLGGIVAYANSVKTELLGVDPEALAREGAVSEVVAIQMAEGARVRAGAQFGLSTTGVAGPGGGTEDKPVGTVWTAIAGPDGVQARKLFLPNRTRELVRLETAKALLDELRLRLISA